MKKILMIILCALSHFSILKAQFTSIGGPEGVYEPTLMFVGDRIYANTPVSIHYSDDDGASWKMIKESQNLGYISGMAVEGNNIVVTVPSDISGLYGHTDIFHTSDLGQNWKKTYSLNGDSFHERNFIDLKNDTLLVATDEKFYFFSDLNQMPFDSIEISNFDYIKIFHLDNWHYLINEKGAYRTKDYHACDTLLKFRDGSLYQSFRNDKNIFITSSDTLGRPLNFKLINGSFELIDTTLSFSAFGGHFFYSNDSIFQYGGIGAGLNLFDDNLKIIKTFETYDYSVFGVGNLYLHKDQVFFNSYNSVDLYRRKYKIDNESSHVISNNLVSTVLEYDNINGQLWNTSMGNPINFNHATQQWNTSMLNIGNWGEVEVINENEFIIKRNSGYEVVNRDGIKIRDFSVPQGLENLKNSNNLLVGVEFPAREIYSSVDAGQTWQKLTFENSISWDFYTSYSNGYYIIHNGVDEFFYSKDGLSWQNLKVTLNTGGSISFDGVQISNTGALYVKDYNKIYKYNSTLNKYEEINSPFSSPDEFRPITSFVVYKNALLLSYYQKGIYLSLNDGASWEHFDDGIPNKNVAFLTIIEDDLYVSTNSHVYRRPMSELNSGQFQCTVFDDINKNGIKDTGENGVPNVKVTTSLNSIIVSTDQNGQADFLSRVITGNKIFVVPPKHCTTTNGPLDIVNPTIKPELGLFFDRNVKDVGIHLYNTGVYRPGFENKMLIVFENLSRNDIPVICGISVDFDAKLEFVSSSIPITSKTLTSLNYENLALKPLERREIIVTYRLDPNTVIGSQLTFDGEIKLDAGFDIDRSNDISRIDATVVGSYDPNDKAATPEKDIPVSQGLNNNEVVYKIRFQNTGNYPADFVRVIDTLDEKFDLRSLKIVSTSHPVEWKLKENNLLEFYFPNINLLDSFTNEALSHGYILYSIKMKPDTKLGDNFKNTAYIYFDYNKPVVTNTVSTAIVIPISVDDEYTNRVQIYPVPVSDILYFKLDGEYMIDKCVIYKLDGSEVKAIKFSGNSSMSLQVGELMPGNYILEIHTEIGKINTKFVKI